MKQRHRKLYEYVVEEIGVRIVKGVYGVGETLPNEDTLSQELDISRGVLREATRVLTQKGLIQTRPKIGTQVTDRSNWNLFDPDVLTWKLQLEDRSEFLKRVTEVRRIIESEAARLAAQRATPTAVDHMLVKLEELHNFFDHPSTYNYQDYLSTDMAFHAAVMKASNNELLTQIAFTMRQAIHSARQADVQDAEIQLESIPLHRAIFEGIKKGDPQAAYDASQKMFDRICRHIPGAV